MTAPLPAPAVETPPPLPLSWREAVNRLPPTYVAVLGLAGTSGIAAGMLAQPLFFWTTPPIVALLVAGGVLAVRQSPPPNVSTGDAPAPTPPPAPPLDLPRDVRPLVAESLARLAPTGDARALLDDVVRLAATLYATTADAAAARRGRGLLPRAWHAWRARADDARAADGGVGELVAAACDCALALDRADVALALLREEAAAAAERSGSARRDPLAGQRREAEGRCERARDALSSRLHETAIALGAACAQAADRAATGDGAERLSELARELARDAELRRAASDEVEALLSGGTRA